MAGRLRRALGHGLLLAFLLGGFLGGDWGAAIAAMIDTRGDRLTRPAEVALAAGLAVLGGAAACWFRNARGD